MAKSKYKAGDRVKFVSHGAMFGSVGTVLLVRKDGHLIIHFDGHPEGSAVFVDLTDVAPEPRVAAGSAEPIKSHATKHDSAQLKREIKEALPLARSKLGSAAQEPISPVQMSHLNIAADYPALISSVPTGTSIHKPWVGRPIVRVEIGIATHASASDVMRDISAILEAHDITVSNIRVSPSRLHQSKTRAASRKKM